MHIIKSLLPEIQNVLNDYYGMNISNNNKDWSILFEPLIIEDKDLRLDSFTAHKEASLRIMNEILSQHGKTYIMKFLFDLAKIEYKIQEVQPWVRDHIYHSINTFLLGVYLIKELDNYFSDYSKNYRFIWKITGPTHDFGYPFEISSNIRRQYLLEMNNLIRECGVDSKELFNEIFPKGLDKLCGKKNSIALIQDRLNEWNLDVNIKDYFEWLKLSGKTDHGVISAMSQLKTIDVIYKKNNPRRLSRPYYVNGLDHDQRIFNTEILDASSAVFLHNISLEYPNFKNKIDINVSPIAFILFLCDTIQEWDRYATHKKMYSGEEFSLKCEQNSIVINVPNEVEKKIMESLSKRLTGIKIILNNICIVN